MEILIFGKKKKKHKKQKKKIVLGKLWEIQSSQ